jgi:hypothetical protein
LSAAQALLLLSSDLIEFMPNAGFLRTATLTNQKSCRIAARHFATASIESLSSGKSKFGQGWKHKFSLGWGCFDNGAMSGIRIQFSSSLVTPGPNKESYRVSFLVVAAKELPWPVWDE